MAVAPYRLHIKHESNQEANQYGEELYGEPELACVSQHKKCRFVPAAARHQDGNHRAKHYRRGSQKGRRHYIVSQCLYSQNAILRHVLRAHAFINHHHDLSCTHVTSGNPTT